MSVENYAKLKLIGRGNYGEAWLMKCKRDRKKYVLKKVDLRCADEKERIAAEQEAQLLSQLKHPNIVAYKESFNTPDGFLCILMGFCEGGDLYHRLQQQNGVLLEEQLVGEWFVQIAMAIKYMHDRHILHRDLKTQNIFLTKSEIIKVGDLGIARVLESSNAMATTMIGTPYYMSPELYSNRPYDYKSDVWALGCCIYEVMTLKHAFDAKNFNALANRIVQGKPPPMPAKYSVGLLNLVKAMLQKNPGRRPTINQILADSYVKEQITAFLDRTNQRKYLPNQHSAVERMSVSAQSDARNKVRVQASLSSKEVVSKSIEELHMGSNTEGVDESEMLRRSSEPTIKPNKAFEEDTSARYEESDGMFKKPADKTDDRSHLLAKTLTSENAKTLNASKPRHSEAAESKRDKRRRKKSVEMLHHAAEAPDRVIEVLSHVPFLINNKTSEEKAKQLSSDGSKKLQHASSAVDVRSQNGSWSAKSGLEIRTEGNAVEKKKVIESVQLFKDAVFYRKESGEDFDAIVRKSPENDSNVLKKHDVISAVSPRKLSGNGEVVVPVDRLDLVVEKHDSPRMKSKRKIARKLSGDSDEHPEPHLSRGAISGQRNATKNEIQSESGERTFQNLKSKTSNGVAKSDNDETENSKPSVVPGRPLPPRPAKCAVEPKKSQFHRKISSSSPYVQSNEESPSVSSSASSANGNSSRDEATNINSSSRLRRRKQRTAERQISKSLDADVPVVKDVGIKIKSKQLSIDDDVDGMDIPKSHRKVSRLLDVVKMAQESHSLLSKNDRRIEKQSIPVVDDQESDSSESSMEEIETIKARNPRRKELMNFISLLSSTLLLKQDKANADGKSDDEVDSISNNHKLLSNSTSDTSLFVKRPLPPLLEHNALSYNDVWQAQDRLADKHLDSHESSGCLFERITALRMDCVRGLGPRKLDEALKLLDKFESEEIEPIMIKLLGAEDFSNYAGKIWQLKFCMQNAFSSRHRQK